MTVAQMVDLAAIALLAVAIPAAVVCQWRQGGRGCWPTLSPLDLPFLGVLVALLVCHPFALDRRYSAWRILVWCGYLAVFYLSLTVPRQWVTGAGRVVGCVVAVICIGEYIVTGQRVALLQGNPNIMAAWLLALFFLGQPSIALLGVMFPALAVTGCRGALAGMAGAVVTVGAAPGRAPVTTRWAIVGLVVLALVIWRPSTVTNRLENWQEAMVLFLRRPIVGWGPGGYTNLAHNEPEHPHADNALLTVAAEMGFVGLAAWLWVIVAAARLVTRSDDVARLGLVAWAIHNIIDDTLWWYWPGLTVMVNLAVVVRSGGGNSDTQGAHST